MTALSTAYSPQMLSSQQTIRRAGTAGDVMQFLRMWFDNTGSSTSPRHYDRVVREISLPAQPTPVARVRDINEIIQHAQLVLGFTIKDLAKVFSVSRQTLYSRMKEGDTSTPHNVERFHDIDDVINAIEQVTTVAFGASAKTMALEGSTLFDELCANPLDKSRVIHLAQMVNGQLSRRSAELAGVSEKALKDNAQRLAPSA